MEFLRQWLQAAFFFLLVALGGRRGRKRKRSELNDNILVESKEGDMPQPDSEPEGNSGMSVGGDQEVAGMPAGADSGSESRQTTPESSAGFQVTGGAVAGPSTAIEPQVPAQATLPAAGAGQQGAGGGIGGGAALSLRDAFGAAPPSASVLKTVQNYGVLASDLRDCRLAFQGQGTRQTIWKPKNLQRDALFMAVIVQSLQKTLAKSSNSQGLLAVILARQEDMTALADCLKAMLKGDKSTAKKDQSPRLTLGELTSSGAVAKKKEILLSQPNILLATPHRFYEAYKLMDEKFVAINLSTVVIDSADFLTKDIHFYLCWKALKRLEGIDETAPLGKLVLIDEVAFDVIARLNEAEAITEDQQRERERARILKRGGNPKVLELQSYDWVDFQGVQLHSNTVSAGMYYEAHAEATELRTLVSRMSPSPGLMEVLFIHMYSKMTSGKVLLLQRDVVSLCYPSGSILEQRTNITEAASLMKDIDWFSCPTWILRLRRVRGDVIHYSIIFILNVNVAARPLYLHFDSLAEKKPRNLPIRPGFYNAEDRRVLEVNAQNLLQSRRHFQETQEGFPVPPPLSKLDLKSVKIDIPRQQDSSNDSAVHAFSYATAVLENPPIAAIDETALTGRSPTGFAAFQKTNLKGEDVRKQMKSIAAELLHAQGTAHLGKRAMVAVKSYIAEHAISAT